jgi:group I intron endonuclease
MSNDGCLVRPKGQSGLVSTEGAATGVVYLITNKANGKKYVGQTSGTLGHRWSQHLNLAKKGSPHAVHGAIRKYGKESFSIEVLEEVRGSREDLLAAEVRHIAAHSCVCPYGYNLTPGGEGVDFSIPAIRENHTKAIRSMTSKDSWKVAQHVGARKRLEDPEWRQHNAEALARMHNSQEWQDKHAEALKTIHSDPGYGEALRRGIIRRSDNQDWRNNHKAAMGRVHADPAYQKKRAEALRRTNEARTAKALALDALCSPEEAAKRAQNRAHGRARYIRAKALKEQDRP